MLSLAFTWNCCTASVQSAQCTASVAHCSESQATGWAGTAAQLRLILHSKTSAPCHDRFVQALASKRKLGSAAQATGAAQFQLILHCTTGKHKRQAGTAAQLQLILHCTTAKQKRHTGTAAQLQLILHCITATPRQALQVTTDLSRPWLANRKLGSAAAQLQLILQCRNCCTASVDSALHYRKAQSTGRNCCAAAVDSGLHYSESLATGWNCCTVGSALHYR